MENVESDHAGVSPSKIRVANEYATWKNGQFVIFDDSYDHEVWHYSQLNQSRLVLIMDIWHPNLSLSQVSINDINGNNHLHQS